MLIRRIDTFLGYIEQLQFQFIGLECEKNSAQFSSLFLLLKIYQHFIFIILAVAFLSSSRRYTSLFPSSKLLICAKVCSSPFLNFLFRRILFVLSYFHLNIRQFKDNIFKQYRIEMKIICCYTLSSPITRFSL